MIAHHAHRIIKRGVARRFLAEKTQLYTNEVYAALRRYATIVQDPQQAVSSPQLVPAADRPRTSDDSNRKHPAFWASHLGPVWYGATYSMHLLLRRVHVDPVSLVRWMVETLAKAFTRWNTSSMA